MAVEGRRAIFPPLALPLGQSMLLLLAWIRGAASPRLGIDAHLVWVCRERPVDACIDRARVPVGLSPNDACVC